MKGTTLVLVGVAVIFLGGGIWLWTKYAGAKELLKEAGIPLENEKMKAAALEAALEEEKKKGGWGWLQTTAETVLGEIAEQTVHELWGKLTSW